MQRDVALHHAGARDGAIENLADELYGFSVRAFVNAHG